MGLNFVGKVTPSTSRFQVLTVCSISCRMSIGSSTHAWVEHIPFVFWLTNALKPRSSIELGTHYGNSYFAFCQAVSKGALSSQCYVVDTWTSEEHAGRYDQTVFETVHAYNRARYGFFFELIQSKFDDAQQHFVEGAIDLLHIDGLHTHDVIKHDFETRRSKMSDRGVVLFHDINVRERDFGVFQLCLELCARYPSFEFLHGHGLGVLGVGKSFDGSVQALFLAAGGPASTNAVHELFLSAAGSLRNRKEFHARHTAEVAAHRQQVDKLGAELLQKETETAHCRQEIQQLREKENELNVRSAGVRKERDVAIYQVKQFRALLKRKSSHRFSSVVAERLLQLKIGAGMRNSGCLPTRQLKAIQKPTIRCSAGDISGFKIGKRYHGGFWRTRFSAELVADHPQVTDRLQLFVEHGQDEGDNLEVSVAWDGNGISVDRVKLGHFLHRHWSLGSRRLIGRVSSSYDASLFHLCRLGRCKSRLRWQGSFANCFRCETS